MVNADLACGSNISALPRPCLPRPRGLFSDDGACDNMEYGTGGAAARRPAARGAGLRWRARGAGTPVRPGGNPGRPAALPAAAGAPRVGVSRGPAGGAVQRPGPHRDRRQPHGPQLRQGAGRRGGPGHHRLRLPGGGARSADRLGRLRAAGRGAGPPGSPRERALPAGGPGARVGLQAVGAGLAHRRFSGLPLQPGAEGLGPELFGRLRGGHRHDPQPALQWRRHSRRGAGQGLPLRREPVLRQALRPDGPDHLRGGRVRGHRLRRHRQPAGGEGRAGFRRHRDELW